MHKLWIDRDGLIVVCQRLIATPKLLERLCATVTGDRAAGIERYRSIETSQRRLRLAELFEGEATIAMCPRIVRLRRDRPLEIVNRLLQIVGLTREHAHGVQYIKVVGFGVQDFLVDQPSGGRLPLLLQGLRPCKVLRESCSDRVIQL